MERLTFSNHGCLSEYKASLREGAKLPNGETDILKCVITKLSRYEDLGYEPEELKEKFQPPTIPGLTNRTKVDEDRYA